MTPERIWRRRAASLYGRRECGPTIPVPGFIGTTLTSWAGRQLAKWAPFRYRPMRARVHEPEELQNA